MSFDSEQASNELGCKVTSKEQESKIVSGYVNALKDIVDLGLQLSGDEILPYQSAPYLDTIVNQWNTAFSDYNLNYSLQIREFNNTVTFVFSDYTTNTMLSGKNLIDLFKPAILLKVVSELKNGSNKVKEERASLENRKGYGVMKRKDFSGNALGHPHYLGEHVYRGKVTGKYLTDTNGKRHAIDSNYVTGFKFFGSFDEMKDFNF